MPAPRGHDRHVEAGGERDRRRDVVGVARERHEQRLERVHARVGARTGGACRRRRARRRAARGRARAASRPLPHAIATVDTIVHDRLPWMRASQRTALPADPRTDERARPGPAGDRRADDRPPRAGLRACSGSRCSRACGTSSARPGPVVVYPASGTGAWEAALVNTLSPGDRVLAFETGHFATLWRGDGRAARARGRVGAGRLAPRRRPGARRRRSLAATRRSAR